MGKNEGPWGVAVDPPRSAKLENWVELVLSALSRDTSVSAGGNSARSLRMGVPLKARGGGGTCARNGSYRWQARRGGCHLTKGDGRVLHEFGVVAFKNLAGDVQVEAQQEEQLNLERVEFTKRDAANLGVIGVVVAAVIMVLHSGHHGSKEQAVDVERRKNEAPIGLHDAVDVDERQDKALNGAGRVGHDAAESKNLIAPTESDAKILRTVQGKPEW